MDKAFRERVIELQQLEVEIDVLEFLPNYPSLSGSEPIFRISWADAHEYLGPGEEAFIKGLHRIELAYRKASGNDFGFGSPSPTSKVIDALAKHDSAKARELRLWVQEHGGNYYIKPARRRQWSGWMEADRTTGQRNFQLLRRIKQVLDRLMADPLTPAEIRLSYLYDHLRRDPAIKQELPTSRAASKFLRPMHDSGFMKKVIPNYRVDTSRYEHYEWFFHRDKGTTEGDPRTAKDGKVGDPDSPNGFHQLWTEFSDRARLAEHWSAGRYTELVIGAPRSEGTGSPFGDHFLARTGAPWRYWKEDGSMDLVLSRRPQHAAAAPPEGWKDFYPVVPEIVLEHENDAASSWWEMGKLVRTRAQLKVLVTYAEEDADQLALAKQFGRLIAEAREAWPEHDRTAYLLLVGSKPATRVHWHAWQCLAGDDGTMKPL